MYSRRDRWETCLLCFTLFQKRILSYVLIKTVDHDVLILLISYFASDTAAPLPGNVFANLYTHNSDKWYNVVEIGKDVCKTFPFFMLLVDATLYLVSVEKGSVHSGIIGSITSQRILLHKLFPNLVIHPNPLLSAT